MLFVAVFCALDTVLSREIVPLPRILRARTLRPDATPTELRAVVAPDVTPLRDALRATTRREVDVPDVVPVVVVVLTAAATVPVFVALRAVEERETTRRAVVDVAFPVGIVRVKTSIWFVL